MPGFELVEKRRALFKKKEELLQLMGERDAKLKYIGLNELNQKFQDYVKRIQVVTDPKFDFNEDEDSELRAGLAAAQVCYREYCTLRQALQVELARLESKNTSTVAEDKNEIKENDPHFLLGLLEIGVITTDMVARWGEVAGAYEEWLLMHPEEEDVHEKEVARIYNGLLASRSPSVRSTLTAVESVTTPAYFPNSSEVSDEDDQTEVEAIASASIQEQVKPLDSNVEEFKQALIAQWARGVAPECQVKFEEDRYCITFNWQGSAPFTYSINAISKNEIGDIYELVQAEYTASLTNHPQQPSQAVAVPVALTTRENDHRVKPVVDVDRERSSSALSVLSISPASASSSVVEMQQDADTAAAPTSVLSEVQHSEAEMDFIDAAVALKKELKKLLVKNNNDPYAVAQISNVDTLVKKMLSADNTVDVKAQAIQMFKQDSEACINAQGSSFKKHRKLITAVITAACVMVGLIGGAILGAFVGGVLGAPTGLGAAVTAAAGAVVAGAKGAVIGAAAGAALTGAGSFVGSRFGFFKTESLVDKVAKQADAVIHENRAVSALLPN